ncbi:MAG TPA: hypothetical protein VEA60_15205 [Allosphingosinicella sp.]|nr:hypothetical protein [Allosphingosinicella sp.]
MAESLGGAALLGLLAAVSQSAGAEPPAARIPADPRIETAFYPAFQAQMQIEKAIRHAPPLRSAFQALGNRACPAYLEAWRAAYDERFDAVREAYYAAVRKHVPEAALARPDLKFLDDSIMDGYGDAVKAELTNGPGLPATKALGIAMLSKLVDDSSARPAAVPMTDGEVDALLARPGVICGVTTDRIEGKANALGS